MDFSEDRPLDFYPMHCANTRCNTIIIGSMFKSDDPKEPGVVCEDCYFHHFYGKDSYVKQYKHCILSEAITPEESRRVCPCPLVPHSNGEEPLSLFPVPGNARHQIYFIDKKECKLCNLDDIVAVAKCKALCKATGIKENKKERGLKSTTDVTKMLLYYQPQPEMSISRTFNKFTKSSSNTRLERSEQHLHSSAALGKTVTDPQAEPDIPAFFKAHADKDLFSNLHMRLRVGPLVIENDASL